VGHGILKAWVNKFNLTKLFDQIAIAIPNENRPKTSENTLAWKSSVEKNAHSGHATVRNQNVLQMVNSVSKRWLMKSNIPQVGTIQFGNNDAGEYYVTVQFSDEPFWR